MKLKRKGGNCNDRVCPITLDHVDDKEGFQPAGDPTVYSAVALFEWLYNQRVRRQPLTYPHNRQRPSEQDIARLEDKYREITGNHYATLQLTYPVPMLEPNQLPSDIRRFYQDFVVNGNVKSLNDARISTKTFHGVLIPQIVQHACKEIVDFFMKPIEEKQVWIRRRLLFIDAYSQQNARDMVSFRLPAEREIVLHNLQLSPYENDDGNLHYLQLSFSLNYITNSNASEWMTIHYAFDKIMVTFGKSKEDAEEAIYTSGYDALLDEGDNPIVLIEIPEIPLHEILRNIGGAVRASRYFYRNKWYRIHVGSRGGHYIEVHGKKIYVH